MQKDPLQYFPVDKWTDIQIAFKADWPRGMSGYTVLETQRKLMKRGFDYGFKVYCPYGDYWNGIVAINEKSDFYEIIIQSPKDDTKKLEEALRKTELINWGRHITIPFAPQHIVECVKRAIQHVGVEMRHIQPSEMFILDKQTPLFQYVCFLTGLYGALNFYSFGQEAMVLQLSSHTRVVLDYDQILKLLTVPRLIKYGKELSQDLPPDITFGKLTTDNVELLDSKWPHRYPTSSWYFELLIRTNNGYGLYLNNSLISWVLINEAGTLSHMYTMEEGRQKGYAEVLLKLVCNIELEAGRHVSAFCVKGNVNACKLYRKLGFQQCEGVAWCYLKNKKKSRL